MHLALLVTAPAACDPPWAALAEPPPTAMPASIVITPIATAILVVQRILISVPLRSERFPGWISCPRNPLQEGY